MRKCKGVGELAVMEASPVLGVRTRSRTQALAAEAADGGRTSSKRRKTATSESRSLVLTPGISKSLADSSAGQRTSSTRGRIYRCSSNCSSEVVEKEEEEKKEQQDGDDLVTAVYDFECSLKRRETTSTSSSSSNQRDEESTADRKPGRSAPKAMPSYAEIEEFFTAAESAMKLRFAEKYNYDVGRDVPLDGRYEWVQLKP